jgi:hypothetical protein
MNIIFGSLYLLALGVLIYITHRFETKEPSSNEEVKDNSVQTKLTGEEIVTVAEMIQKQEEVEVPKKKKSRPRKKPASKVIKKD